MQTQRGGDHSNQVQVLGNLVVQGVTEERAAEIAREVSLSVVQRFTDDAEAIAQSRVNELTTRLIPLLAEGKRLEAFGDPSFQFALREAANGAASTDRDADYEILAALLNDHAARADARPVKAGIRRAIEVVDQLDTEALTGLTLYAALAQYRPTDARLDPGLAQMDALYESLLAAGEPPPPGPWIEHLDILDAVRVNSVMSFPKYREAFPQLVPGYVSVGLEDGTEDTVARIRRAAERGIEIRLIPHELKPGYVRFPASSDATLQAMYAILPQPWRDGFAETVVSEFKALEPDPALYDALVSRVMALPSFGRVAAWWDGLRPYFTLTPVGRVLARANAARLYEGMLPPIE